MRSSPRIWLLPSLMLLTVACGSEPEPEPAQSGTSSGGEDAAAAPRMEVSGLMGTIPERKIQATLEPKLPSFQRCFARGAERVETIAGSMQFYFRVGIDGRVEWVYPKSSTVGDRETERCLLQIAQAARFPEPKGGGAAELSWGFELDGSDVRPPVAWEEARVREVVAAQHASLEACGLEAGTLLVTAYVAPEGHVVAAGASAASREAAAQIDCALSAISAWPMPDPGSYPAKVSFRVP